MDDGIKELARMVVDFALKVELTNEEEQELLDLIAAAYRAGGSAFVRQIEFGTFPQRLD
jgi:hypothetical protein